MQSEANQELEFLMQFPKQIIELMDKDPVIKGLLHLAFTGGMTKEQTLINLVTACHAMATDLGERLMWEATFSTNERNTLPQRFPII